MDEDPRKRAIIAFVFAGISIILAILIFVFALRSQSVVELAPQQETPNPVTPVEGAF